MQTDRKTDERTDMTRLVVTFRNSANAPKKFCLRWCLNEVRNVFLSASLSESARFVSCALAVPIAVCTDVGVKAYNKGV